MSDDKQGLPFRMFDSMLGRMKKMVDSGSDLAKSSMPGQGRDETGGSGNAAPTPNEASSASSEGAADQEQVLGRVASTDTATAAPALATAMDEEAKAAIAKHVGEDGAVTDGLALKAQSGRVAPDEELGPEPFTPQVGP